MPAATVLCAPFIIIIITIPIPTIINANTITITIAIIITFTFTLIFIFISLTLRKPRVPSFLKTFPIIIPCTIATEEGFRFGWHWEI